MMSRLDVVTQKANRTKNQIIHILEQLTSDYQTTKSERQKIAANFPASNDEFSLLEELELLTVNIRGYASQIQVKGEIQNQQQAVENLNHLGIFDIPAVAQFYFGSNGEYQSMKAYLEMLDYLRLLILEYLSFSAMSSRV
ncbi:hypothetical protein [Nostoc sp. 'Peltigera membranacea cyanobiont' 210A]|uniref:hypothetical protein n=1 Tax=Nostoc sp. 'Peltigera membranacea cyanobiont' 210A TaxID=2014529 RepID=UPI00294FF6C7|nr:hypothetical protein [Nostoc sp. 'Peltigera membranacea cyanobiont' 210A]